MVFEDELKTTGSGEITIQTRIGAQIAKMIEKWAPLYKSRNDFILSSFRSLLFTLHNTYQKINDEISDELITQTGKNREDTISLLVRSRYEKELTITQSCSNTVQINMKISRQLAEALDDYNAITVRIGSIQPFINFACYLEDEELQVLSKDGGVATPGKIILKIEENE